jgi:DNA-binding IclR family transcriptional regulator
MNKQRVLELFAVDARFVTPDEIRTRLRQNLQRSTVYSYLSRLCRQGLLERAPEHWQQVAYCITPKGRTRLKFFLSRNLRRDGAPEA